MNSQEMSADLAELKTLESTATRPNVKAFLQREILRLEKCGQTANGVPEQKGFSINHVTLTVLTWITRFAPWDQSDKFVKIYVTLAGAQTAAPDQINAVYTDRGVKLRVKNLGGKNHEFEINNFLHEILPSNSYHKPKTDTILLMLKKQEDGKTWDTMTMQEHRSKEKKTPKFDDKADPQAGLMNMMKQMYDEGDDDMKRDHS